MPSRNAQVIMRMEQKQRIALRAWAARFSVSANDLLKAALVTYMEQADAGRANCITVLQDASRFGETASAYADWLESFRISDLDGENARTAADPFKHDGDDA